MGGNYYRKPDPKTARKEARRPAASRTGFTWRDRLAGWLAHHRESSRDALRRLWQHPVATLLTLLTLAIALALPAGLSIVVQNVQQATAGWDGQPHLSVFLKRSLSSDRQKKLVREWGTRAGIEKVTLITPSEALDALRQQSGDHNILAALPDNPLPPVLVVYPATHQPGKLQQLKQSLLQQPQVDKVVLDVAWVRKLNAFIALAERLITGLTLLLGIGIVLVVNNTLQLAIENRRDEIIVMKTVGGTNGFVRRPFLYTGFWYGVGGGILALILIGIAFGFIGEPARALFHLYGSDQGLSGMSVSSFLLLPLLAGLLGLAGAFLAVSRHIHELEPRQI